MPSRGVLLVPDIVASSVLACGTLLVYDLLILFDQEVHYVWRQPWSLGTALYFLNRYLPFIDTFLSLHLLLGNDTAMGCTMKFTAVTWGVALGLIISETILVLRTYAIWGRERYILIALSISCFITYITAIVIVELEIKSYRYIPNPVNVCELASASAIIIVAYIALAISETTIAVLTGIKAYRHFRTGYSTSDWIGQMYREGLLFYVYLLGISIANILVPILAPAQFDNWLATPQRVMHSVLSNRVLLLILKQRPSAGRSTSAIHSAALPEFIHPHSTDDSQGTWESAVASGQISDDTKSSTGVVHSDIEIEPR